MSRFLLAILLLLISFSLVAQVAFFNRYNAVQTILAEEEIKSEQESEGKKVDSIKDKISPSNLYIEQRSCQVTALPAIFEYLNISKGFTDKPYTPPELN
ncbi:MAG: hypothetical protein ICV79_12940 [Flavisolibacter sp.]|nr:hypothetical protein [Flavisolibacter sp.]